LEGDVGLGNPVYVFVHETLRGSSEHGSSYSEVLILQGLLHAEQKVTRMKVAYGEHDHHLHMNPRARIGRH
jgi:hypothetical protein